MIDLLKIINSRDRAVKGPRVDLSRADGSSERTRKHPVHR